MNALLNARFNSPFPMAQCCARMASCVPRRPMTASCVTTTTTSGVPVHDEVGVRNVSPSRFQAGLSGAPVSAKRDAFRRLSQFQTRRRRCLH